MTAPETGDRTIDVSLSLARAPSFWQGTSNGISYSGRILLPFGMQSLYSLRVEDLSRRIPLVQDLPALRNQEKVGTTRMISTLLKLKLGRDDFDIVKFNNALQKYRTKNEATQDDLSAILAEAGLPSWLDKYFSLYAWVDNSTIRSPTGEDVIPQEASLEKAQDAKDFARQGKVAEATLSISLCDAKGYNLAKPFSNVSNGIDLSGSSRVYFRVMFELSEGPVLSAPMLDDLTLTYSTGVKYLERK